MHLKLLESRNLECNCCVETLTVDANATQDAFTLTSGRNAT